MKKMILFFAAFFIFQSLFCAELTARFVTVEAAKKDTVEESIEYLKSNAKTISNPAEKRAVYIFLASLLEQMAFFDEAQKYYAMAAGISASDAQGMPKKTNEQIVLDAVRCALSSGDFATADSYLNSAVRNSKDGTVQAYIKLYSQWSELCKANSASDINEPILMLLSHYQNMMQKMILSIKMMQIVKMKQKQQNGSLDSLKLKVMQNFYLTK